MQITPLKSNMSLENHHFQWEIHLQMVEFPASHVSFRGGGNNLFRPYLCLFCGEGEWHWRAYVLNSHEDLNKPPTHQTFDWNAAPKESGPQKPAINGVK